MVYRLLKIDSGVLEQLLRTFPGSQINRLPSRLHLLFLQCAPPQGARLLLQRRALFDEGLQEIVWVDSVSRGARLGDSPPAPQAPGSLRKVVFGIGIDDRMPVCKGDAAFRVETPRQCFCIGASGSGIDRAPNSRVEPARIISIIRIQPTQIPDASLMNVRCNFHCRSCCRRSLDL